MKTQHTLFMLLLLIGSFLKAQTNYELIGVCNIQDTSGAGYPKTAFTKIDPANGNLEVINKWSNQNIHAFGSHTLDPKNKMYYQVSTDPWDMFILKIDLNTGIIVDTIFTQDSIGMGDTTVNWISGEINGLFYNCADESVYFFYNTPNKQVDNSSVQGTRLAKANGVTGEVSLVKIFPPFLYADQQRCDKTHQKIFLYSYHQSNQLTVYDLQTKKIYSRELSKEKETEMFSLLMNTGDDQLYGYESDYSFFTNPKFMAKSRMVKVNPTNGEVTYLSDFFDFNGMGTMSLDPSNNTLYFLGSRTNPGSIGLFSFDITTRKLISYSSSNLPQTGLWLGVHDIDNTPLDTAFTCKNFCQNVGTEFNPTSHGGSLQWDFGDPASGVLNTSNEINPRHIYTQPGVYNIKMTASNCWESRTTKKQIFISAFPKVDIGNDVVWCNNKPNAELHLKVNVPGATYLWQDQSTADAYTVNKEGLYWVKVSAACEVTDSLRVIGAICPCDITVLPTVTHATISFLLECDLSAYEQLDVEIYNERGQIVRKQEIVQSNTIINFTEFAAGAYFYRIRDKGGVIKSGKVVYIR